MAIDSDYVACKSETPPMNTDFSADDRRLWTAATPTFPAYSSMALLAPRQDFATRSRVNDCDLFRLRGDFAFLANDDFAPTAQIDSHSLPPVQCPAQPPQDFLDGVWDSKMLLQEDIFERHSIYQDEHSLPLRDYTLSDFDRDFFY